MKPHRLQIEAFGPFANPVEIDFDALSEQGLFLIHGRTGAGKTFLLDALCFALYGEVSGDRNVKGLKSDHAAAAAVPRVTLQFSCGGRRYRVSRTPAWSAPRSRGEGTTDKPAQAVLERETERGLEPISNRTSEVNREVEGLVGLNGAQFRQVILLPQGRFAEVLRARADEREALLRTLFDTVLFDQAARWLEDQARADRSQLQDQERTLTVMRQQAFQEWQALRDMAADHLAGGASPSPEDPDAAKPPEPPEAGAPPTDQQGLEALRQELDQLLDRARELLQRAEADRLSAQQGKETCDALAARWDRRAEAAARLAERDSHREAVEDYRQRLMRAEQAETLRGSLEAEQQASEAFAQLESSLREGLRSTAIARDGSRALPASLQALDLSELPEPETLAQVGNGLAARRAELTALVAKAAEANQLRHRARASQQAALQAGERRKTAEAALVTLEQQRSSQGEALLQARRAADQIEGLQLAAREATRISEAATAIAQAETLLSRSQADQRRCQQDLERAAAALRQLQQQQIDGMAIQLAAALTPGHPCPVCGSSHHPQPARGALPEQQEQQLNEAEARLREAQEVANQAISAVARAESQLQALRDQAGAAAASPEAARQESVRAQALLEAAQKAAKTLEILQSTLRDLDGRQPQLLAERQAAETEQAVLQAAGEQENRRAEALELEITTSLGQGLDPQCVLDDLDRLEPLLQALQRSGRAFTQGRSLLAQASERLERELAASPFADRQAVREALQEQATRQRWSDRLQAYDRERQELKGLLASPDLADLPDLRPDTAAAAAALAATDGQRTQALTWHTQVERGQRELARLCKAHRQGNQELQQQRQRAQLTSAMADRCQGKTAPYISLQRWVLSAYLEEICGHANRRLEQMTGGRYQLRLSDEGGRGGRLAGLALRVLDAYTGEEREVNSLSGGETFQASLALALGVAETVEEHAGGLHLEALFIDEGFGTLDPDTLQLAMDELDRLREGGRLIGIISHVSALRERIHAGIEVLAGERGSSLRVGRLQEL